MSFAMGQPDSLSYAGRRWASHVKFCNDENIDDLVAQFLTAWEDAKPTWIEDGFMPFMDVYRVIKTDDESAVLKAARLDLDGVIKCSCSGRDTT